MRKLLISKAFKLYPFLILAHFDSDQELSVCVKTFQLLPTLWFGTVFQIFDILITEMPPKYCLSLSSSAGW